MNRRRRGFALVELVIALIVLTIIGGTIYGGLVRQQRLFRSLAVMLATRSDVRDAAEVLASDLATISISDTLRLAADSALEFFSVIGSSVLCSDALDASIRLPPEDLSSGAVLTSFMATPDTGDLALVYRSDTLAAGGAGTWIRRRITSVSRGALSLACSSGAGFTSSADEAAGAQAFVMTLDAAVDSAAAGATVRFLRRARYSLYRSSDSKWYLGYRRCNAAGAPACGTIQPVSGPYASYGGESSGMVLRYFDATGNLLSGGAAQTLAVRVDAELRASPDGVVEVARVAATRFTDSSATSVAFRGGL